MHLILREEHPMECETRASGQKNSPKSEEKKI